MYFYFILAVLSSCITFVSVIFLDEYHILPPIRKKCRTGCLQKTPLGCLFINPQSTLSSHALCSVTLPVTRNRSALRRRCPRLAVTLFSPHRAIFPPPSDGWPRSAPPSVGWPRSPPPKFRFSCPIWRRIAGCGGGEARSGGCKVRHVGSNGGQDLLRLLLRLVRRRRCAVAGVSLQGRVFEPVVRLQQWRTG